MASALAAALGFATAPAFAQTTLFNITNPNSDGSFTATTGTTTLADSKSNTAISCVLSSVPGTMYSASGVRIATGINDQNYVGGVSGASYADCTGPDGSFSVDGSGRAWEIYATSYDSCTKQMAVSLYVPSDYPIKDRKREGYF